MGSTEHFFLLQLYGKAEFLPLAITQVIYKGTTMTIVVEMTD